VVETHSLGDELGRAAGNSALLDDDGTLAGVLGDDGSDGLESSHVGGAASTDAALLGGRVDRDEDNIGFGDAAGHISGEEEVALAGSDTEVAKVGVDGVGVAGGLVGEEGLAAAITGDADNVMQAGLVDGRVSRVPATNSGLVAVDDGDLDVRVLEGEDCRGRTACEEGVR
jgi:hypothetical protein